MRVNEAVAFPQIEAAKERQVHRVRLCDRLLIVVAREGVLSIDVTPVIFKLYEISAAHEPTHCGSDGQLSIRWWRLALTSINPQRPL
jgi:hypothetical protein